MENHPEVVRLKVIREQIADKCRRVGMHDPVRFLEVRQSYEARVAELNEEEARMRNALALVFYIKTEQFAPVIEEGPTP